MHKACLMLLVAVLVAAGCVHLPWGSSPAREPAVAPEPTAPPPARVEAGMSAAQAAELLGEPAQVEPAGVDRSYEVWYYKDGVVILRNGRVEFCWAATARLH